MSCDAASEWHDTGVAVDGVNKDGIKRPDTFTPAMHRMWRFPAPKKNDLPDRLRVPVQEYVRSNRLQALIPSYRPRLLSCLCGWNIGAFPTGSLFGKLYVTYISSSCLNPYILLEYYAMSCAYNSRAALLAMIPKARFALNSYLLLLYCLRLD